MLEYANSIKRMPQLDGLRGIAIFFVLIAHWITPAIGMTLPYGTIGVRLFFVLSGFLITGILLRAKNEMESGGQTIGFTLRHFYARRSLRIVAVYYLYLFITIVFFNLHAERWLWDFAYISNYYDIFLNDGKGLHYWSLAVEEQFYLVWPFVVLMVPGRVLLKTFWSVIAIAILIRIGLAVVDVEYLKVKKLTLTCMDALGLGAVISYLLMRDGPGAASLRAMCRWTAVSGGTLFVASIVVLHISG